MTDPAQRLFDEILAGLDLAKRKGCPVESIWVNVDTHNELSVLNGETVRKIQGHHVSIVRQPTPWAIRLECGWTDHMGMERTAIVQRDVMLNPEPRPTWQIDPDEPLTILGHPEIVVTITRQTAPGHYEGTATRQGFPTIITFRDNGWITSTTYSQDRVVNVSQQNAVELMRQKARDEAIAMENHPSWATF